MKKFLQIIIASILIICLLLGLGYLGLSVYYENGFSFQTYINGIYCTGKSVEAVNQELNDAFEYNGLTVVTKQGTFSIDTEKIEYSYDYREPLNHYLKQQNPYLWIENLFGNQEKYSMLPSVSYNENMLEEILEKEIAAQKLPASHHIILRSGKNGFELQDTKQDILDKTKMKEVVKKALADGRDTIDIEKEGCYYNQPYTAEEEKLLVFYKQAEQYQSRKVVYHFGEETEKLDAGDLAQTLTCFSYFQTGKKELPESFPEGFLSQDGTLSVEKEAVDALLDDCFEPYNTYRNHTFTTHDGRTLKIKGGTYGNQINVKREKEELLAFLQSEETEYDREPLYSKEVPLKGKDDIGDTYIEVDIGNQKMFYYRNGELYLETDVVTGKNNATREEVCYVYGKQKNRILRGPGYASPVKYWMPVSGGIGIHDSSWRSEYGGDIYIRNGSHGCVNTPLEIAEKMYEVVEIGTPCIMYYGIDEN